MEVQINSFIRTPESTALEGTEARMREVAVMSRRFSGEDALAYQEGPQDPAAPVNHVQKRLQKRKGVEVVFDPKSHK